MDMFADEHSHQNQVAHENNALLRPFDPASNVDAGHAINVTAEEYEMLQETLRDMKKGEGDLSAGLGKVGLNATIDRLKYGAENIGDQGKTASKEKKS